MRLDHENTEKINDLSPFINWIETPVQASLALLAEHPALDPDHWRSLFSPRERAEGRQKSAPVAFRAWFLGRLAAKAAARRLRGQGPDRDEILKGP